MKMADKLYNRIEQNLALGFCILDLDCHEKDWASILEVRDWSMLHKLELCT